MALTDVAFAAGFGSVRQFNDTIREVFATAPTDLRTSRTSRRTSSSNAKEGMASGMASGAMTGSVSLRLPTRQPFAGDDVLAFLGQRTLAGIESWDGETYRRALRLPNGHGVVTLRAMTDHVAADVRLESWSDLGAAVQRIRRLLDLDADPEAIDAALSTEPIMATLVATTPGRRSPGSTDPFETGVRAIVGQQVSVAGARTVTSKLIEAVGDRLSLADRELTHVFPSAARFAEAEDAAFAMPGSRRATLRRFAAAIADGTVTLGPGSDPDLARASLLDLKGVGPWTADYIVMRGLSHPDVFLGSDLGVRHAIDRLTDSPPDPSSWAPWRSYAIHHLWADLTSHSAAAASPVLTKPLEEPS